MRLLFAVHGWPPEGCGGTEISTRALVLALRRAGHDVRVVAGSLLRARSGGVELEPTEEPDVVRLSRPDLYFEHWHKGRSPAVGARWRELIGDFAPHVVHVQHWLRLTRDLVRIAAEAGVPSVVTLHDFHVSCPLNFRLRPATGEFCDEPPGSPACPDCAGVLAPPTPFVGDADARLAARDADLRAELALAAALVVPSRAHADALEEGFADGSLARRCEVIPPAPAFEGGGSGAGRDTERKRRADGRLRLATWGHVVPIKGLDVIVAAIARTAEPERYELDVAGPEPDPAYRAELERLGARATVRFHGPFAPADLARHARHRLAEADLFVSGSRARESYGLTLDEAWRLGLPALVPAVGAFAQRAPWAYPVGDVAALANELERARQAPALLARERERALELAAALPTADDVAARHAALYARAVRAPLAARPSRRSAREDDEERAAHAAWDRAVSGGHDG